MKKSLIYFFVFTAISVLTLALSGCGQGEDATGQKNDDVLVMGTSADYKPFEYIDTASGGEIIGFDIDLAKAITKELGYELKIVDMDFKGLIPALQAGRVDFVAASMSATEEREKSVDFSVPYYHAGDMVLSLEQKPVKSIAELKNLTVGAQLGSVQEEKAKELAKEIPGMKIKTFNRVPDIIQELKSGRIDAAIIDQSVGEGFIAHHQVLTGFKLPQKSAGTAIAFPNGSKLVEPFNRVIKQMKENGELQELKNKWFGGQQ